MRGGGGTTILYIPRHNRNIKNMKIKKNIGKQKKGEISGQGSPSP
jgi:hypothetical protein